MMYPDNDGDTQHGIDTLSMAPCRFCEHPSDSHKKNRYHYNGRVPNSVAVCNAPFCTCVRDVLTQPSVVPAPKTLPVYRSNGTIMRWE